MDEREEIDRIMKSDAAALQRLATTVAAVQEQLAVSHARLVALGRSLERRKVLDALREPGDEGGAPASDAAAVVAQASSDAPVAPTSGAGRRASTRILILAALRDAGGSLPKADVRDIVISAGWAPETYKRMRGRLKSARLIIDADEGRSWAITDEARRQLDDEGGPMIDDP